MKNKDSTHHGKHDIMDTEYRKLCPECYDIAAEDANFGYPPTRIMGSPPSHMWTYLAGPQWTKRILLTGGTLDGRTAERAGLALMAVPAARLAEEVHKLALEMATVPGDILAANKSICNKAIDLMGRHVLQQLAGETDAMAHKSPQAIEAGRIVAERGLKGAYEWQREQLRKGHGEPPASS